MNIFCTRVTYPGNELSKLQKKLYYFCNYLTEVCQRNNINIDNEAVIWSVMQITTNWELVNLRDIFTGNHAL